jgi:hypothetical protein
MEERRTEVEYPEFIHGVDATTGKPLRHSCDPDKLGSYFDEDNSRLHYLTPVNIKREVLIPYAQEPNRYRLKRSRLECLSITPEYESMIGPLSDDPVALQGPLILLAKCFVDALDPAPLKTFLGDAQSGEKSLSLPGRTAERLGGARDDVEGLRALYDVRSAGGFAHLGGFRREAALTRLGIADLSTIDAFDHVAIRIIGCLQQITALLEAQ